MNIIVFVIGLLILLAGVLFVFAPVPLKQLFEKFLDGKWMFWMVIFRIIIGVLFVFAADATKYPQFIFWLGIVVLLSAIVLPLMGKERVVKFVKRWLDQPNSITIVWAVIASLLGLLIIYSADI